jgi:hypothetical protein
MSISDLYWFDGLPFLIDDSPDSTGYLYWVDGLPLVLAAPPPPAEVTTSYISPTTTIYPPVISDSSLFVTIPFISGTSAIYEPTITQNVELPYISPTTVIYEPGIEIRTAARITQIHRSTLGEVTDEADARVTAITRHALGATEPEASARVTALTRHTLGATEPEASGRITQIRRSVLGPAPEITFSNATLFVGLTWIEVTTRTGGFYVWAAVDLPDPDWYYGGFKEARVIEWGKIRRSLSAFDGQYETTDFNVTLSDTDRIIRELDNDNELIGASVIVRMITDEERRATQVPRTAYRGIIRGIKAKSTLEYQLTIKDPFSESFLLSSATNTLPKRKFTIEDFPNCATELVKSSAWDYVVDADYTTVDEEGVPYETVDEEDVPIGKVLIRDGYGQYAKGDKIKFAGHTTIYTVSGSSFSDPETYVEFTPNLTDAVEEGEAITQIATHKIEMAIGKRIPIWYGHITDYEIVDSLDYGDGQGQAIYVGDRELDDGKVYGEWIVSGHASYSPLGRPIQHLYFFNESIDNLSTGSFYLDGILLENLILGDFATEVGSGGRIAVPGYGLWTDLGFTTSYADINSHRYTRFFMRGIWRDWALGITAPPDNLGGPFAIDAYGCETVGDGTGSLIQKGFKQYRHVIQNWCPPIGDSYETGLWQSSPSYPDGTSMIDDASFDTANTQSAAYVTGGFEGNFIIGADDEEITARELLTRFNLSLGCDSGFNRKVQYFVNLFNTDLDTISQKPELDYIRDIFTGTFDVDELDREIFTSIDYRHTQDYLKRVSEGWRSITSGELEVTNATSETLFQLKNTYSQLFLYMIRGKNRDTDSDEYENGTETAERVLALKLARISNLQRLPKLQTGPEGFNYELADIFPLTHYGGISATGWNQELVRIERLEYDPSEFTCYIEGYQIAPMLEE